MSPLLSVVVPCYNEEACIAETHRRLLVSLAGTDFELLYIDDGSLDETLAVLRKLSSSDPRVHVTGLSRNFGHQAAVTAGIDRAAGEAIVLIDADLQDPPELIPEMLRLWREGYHVVYGRRKRRHGEGIFKRGSAHVFYRLMNRLSEVPIPLDTGDFRLMDRRVAEVLRQMPERARFVRGMVSWAGFRQTALPYERAERLAGDSKYPLKKMFRFATDGILSFSTEPLRLATKFGMSVSLAAVAGILYAIVLRLFTSNWVSGWTLLMISILFLGGVQLVFLGVIGEYLGRIYSEVKGRPLYIVSFDSDARDGDGERLTRADVLRREDRRPGP